MVKLTGRGSLVAEVMGLEERRRGYDRPIIRLNGLSALTMTVWRQEIKARGLEVARLAILVAAVFGSLAAAFDGPMALASTTQRLVVNRHTGLALSGVDPVAYFTDAQMLVGRPEVELTAEGAVWRFRSEDNRAFFLAQPQIYAPRYGGYDPVDVARGVTVAGNPRLWVVHGERLYLFAREESQAAFAADPEKVLRAAADKWPDLRETLAQ